MKVVIYARVSTDDQTTANQTIPLEQYCNRMGYQYDVFLETESSRNTRPVQQKVLNGLLRKEWDGLVIYKFDRWARSTTELVGHMEQLINKGVLVYSYSENIDLSSSMGRAMLTIISAFAQLERDLIQERTMAGLKRAKAWGKIGGRHPLNCGCGATDKNGNKHNGTVKPLRDASNKFIGWSQ
jgi:DNA invertase Pin-like site-specific DNA recombinase